MRVLVTGGRDFNDYAAMRAALDNMHAAEGTIAAQPISLIIHGACGCDANEPFSCKLEFLRGADALADRWARENGIPVKRMPAEWTRLERAAGPVRNQKMLDEGKPDLVIAFPGGKGTAGMIKLANKAKVPVYDFRGSDTTSDLGGDKT